MARDELGFDILSEKSRKKFKRRNNRISHLVNPYVFLSSRKMINYIFNIFMIRVAVTLMLNTQYYLKKKTIINSS